jgi:hypothetical protein
MTEIAMLLRLPSPQSREDRRQFNYLSCECVIVADYNVLVFTRSSSAPACSSNVNTHVEANTPPCEKTFYRTLGS